MLVSWEHLSKAQCSICPRGNGDLQNVRWPKLAGRMWGLFIYYFLLILQKGGGRREKETESEGNINWLPLILAPTWDQTHNPGMCPNWELKQQPFTLQDDAQPSHTSHGRMWGLEMKVGLLKMKFFNQPWLVWLGWLEHHPLTERFQVSIPSWDIYLGCGFDPWSRYIRSPLWAHMGGNRSMLLSCIDVSLPSFLSLKAMKNYPRVRIKRKIPLIRGFQSY